MPTPLMQLATISVRESRADDPSFDLQPCARLSELSRPDLGLTPNNDGKVIRLNLPPLTQERRHDLVKLVHNRLEEARVAVRNVRRDGIKDLREFEHEKLISEDELEEGEENLQKLTQKYIDQVNEIGEKKEKEIMEV
jgi:ribosome recycling factor